MNVDAYMNSLILVGELVSAVEDITKDKTGTMFKFKLKVITKPFDSKKPNVEQEIPIIVSQFQSAAVRKAPIGTPLIVKAKVTCREVPTRDGRVFDSLSVVAVGVGVLDAAVYKATAEHEPEFSDDIPF